jgi:multidrug efflux pump
MALIQKDLPTGLQAYVAYDATNYINNAIQEVITTLGETSADRGGHYLPVPGVAAFGAGAGGRHPISLIGGIFLMQVFGFTINLLTLLAIVLSVGLVVDDAIVVVENVERHLREGRVTVRRGHSQGRELTGPIIAMTVTLIAVYTPIGLQGGLTGSLFREFAFTLAGAVTISGVVALTLSPMLSSKLLNAEDEQHWLPAHINAAFERLKQFYGRVLDSALSGRPAVYLLWATLALLVVPMWMFSAEELAPARIRG